MFYVDLSFSEFDFPEVICSSRYFLLTVLKVAMEVNFMVYEDAEVFCVLLSRYFYIE